MNLHNQLPSNIYVIATDVVDTVGGSPAGRPKKGKFFSVTCTAAGTVKVTGGGIFQYVDVSVATDVHQNFLDPDTGVAYSADAAMNTDDDQFFETLSTVQVSIPMIAGQTIYGRFDSVESDGTFTGFAYAG